MAEKSESLRCREKGNALFSAINEQLSPCLIKSRYTDALIWYERAKNKASKQEEKCSAAKNVAVASHKLGFYLSQRNESVVQRHYHFKEALINYDIAYRFGSCKSHDWLDSLLAAFQDTTQDAINDLNLLTFDQKMRGLEDYTECITNCLNQRAELLIEIAKLKFNHGIGCLANKDYKSCLYQMHECYRPIEEAIKYGKDYNFIQTEIRIMKQDVFVHTCIAESAQARCKGDEILEAIIMDEEKLNMDMVWKVVDLYKEAIILSKENDMEVEAIALSRLGNVNDKILKDKIRAKACYRRAIQLAMSLHPRTFDAEEWFKDCHKVLERYQQEVVQHEMDAWKSERKQFVDQLKDEIKKIKEANSKSDVEFLKYVYINHPPKGKATIPEEWPEKDSENFKSKLKTLYRNAVIHYHPDKVKIETDGKLWKVLCEEISSLLTCKYEYFKG